MGSNCFQFFKINFDKFLREIEIKSHKKLNSRKLFPLDFFVQGSNTFSSAATDAAKQRRESYGKIFKVLEN